MQSRNAVAGNRIQVDARAFADDCSSEAFVYLSTDKLLEQSERLPDNTGTSPVMP